MARVGGSYESVVRGVSEQAPQDRRSGQMWEQVNMISDPVRGLSRRKGSQYQNAQRILGTDVGELQVMDDTPTMVVQDFTVNGVDYDLIYSKTRRTTLGPMYCYDKTNKTFLPITGTGVIWDALVANGVSGLTNIGRFLFIAAHGYYPTYTTTQVIEEDSAAKRITLWVRNGDYNRNYRFRYTDTSGVTRTASYTTPSATYSGVLDTSQVPVPTIDVSDNPDADTINRRLAKFNSEMSAYNKQVADITNTYNMAVTAWVRSSSAAIQPSVVATELAAVIQAETGGTLHVEGTYIHIDYDANIRAGTAVDGGDNTYLRAVVSSTDDPAQLTPQAWYGKVIRVKSTTSQSTDPYYVRAEPQNAGDASVYQYGSVTWRECPGVETTPTSAFAFATVSGGVLYVGSSPAELNTLTGRTDTPTFYKSSVGDLVTSPLPAFLNNRQIDYLGNFQDRLLVGCGSTIFASRPGSYLNWFRASVLVVKDNDPVEMYALGSEDDTIVWDASFDRNHVMFGRKYQYMLPGRAMLSPSNPTIQIMSRIEDAVRAQPQSSGNFVFYAKDTQTKGSLHQIQIGATADSAESYECSQQLDKYLEGKPVQILCDQSPFNILVRTRSKFNGFYVYTYLDSMQGGERLFDSWSKWEWDEKLGSCVGVQKFEGELLVYTVRVNSTGGWLVCDKFTFDTDTTTVPMLDSWRSYTAQEEFPLWWDSSLEDNAAVAYRSTHEYFLLGSDYKSRDANIPEWREDVSHLVVGTKFPAYFAPTSPYIRDRRDRAVITGRLTVGAMTLSVSDTGGLEGTVQLPDRSVQMASFNGRLLSRQSNRAGVSPLVDTTVRVPIHREIREFKLYVSALTWLPLTVTGIEWIGQWFSNVKRV
ncbi:tail tubular protein B [Pectobacterium phage Arno160]|uniref:Tail tubular protein B n=1 Tax=Pectobacterium phage Arno160 TaxID=2488835 RepID=A0A3G8F2F4_9CAUD|nr:tail tubular protein B [Pectobacterium phage Arno160]AZF88099.1 tail tubular protein B [Pectobacterium phage Arno160]